MYVDQKLRREMEAASALLAGTAPVQFHVGMTSGVKLLKDRSLLVGSVVQEGPAMTANQMAPLMVMDVVTAPSFFCRNAILSSGIPRRKVEYLPYPLDTTKWHPGVERPAKEDRFRFLFMNTAYERKGIDLLIKAWLEEFSADDGVELTIKSHRENTRLTPVVEMIVKAAKGMGAKLDRKAPIVVIDEPMHDRALPKFMASFDAYVSPHRAEGFGMNTWYAMALGVPVVCTQYGGTMDFANEDTAWMVSVDKVSKPSPSELANIPMLEGVAWAEPSIDSLRRAMRQAFKDRQASIQKSENGARLVTTTYSYQVVAGMLKDVFEKRRSGSWEELCAGRNFYFSLPDRFVSEELPVRLFDI